MNLPTSRELELEVSLRQRDAQVAELSDEITRLRQYLARQPGPSTTDPITLPPAYVSMLLPQLDAASRPSSTAPGSTVTAALTQKVKALQEENDELYQILQYSETSKLKEEVHVLRSSVTRLESALRESDQTVSALCQELEKSKEAFAGLKSSAYSKSSVYSDNSHSAAQSHLTSNGNARTTFSKPLPTGPKGHKRPRLSDTQASTGSSGSNPPPQRSYRPSEPRGRSPRPHTDSHGKHRSESRMDVDGESRARPRSSIALARDRERGRGREERAHSKEHSHKDEAKDVDEGNDRGRDRTKAPRRNGNFNVGRPSGGSVGGASSRKHERSNSHRHSQGGDRTLKERMGL
ncbi:hypothetical protein PC9H_005004 [Pleurotus ostreatus]|uniref:Uncharacterized protein n=1 Tax=Pleurotus ostreatus TaxID=5322 RepID=A0A8H7DWM3_PLEOS|nr:uncharacterized protein PC9H_005004 [Pleurotus ostreatus]KAF7433058.1 hypothetical protein PC9H_005004 [Pleurotus ostreatus]KAJ8698327.1 hypothetical protein PTI98_005048 [Pleurotus ostreatus]